MKVLLTGANGLLGQHLIRELLKRNEEVYAIGKGADRNAIGGTIGYRYYEADITDGLRMNEIAEEVEPDILIHAAAITQVDECELDKPGCYNANVTATRFLIDAIKPFNAKIIFLSTDFIFDGTGGPYKEDAIPSPVNYYGSTKVQAEKAVMESGLPYAILRTILVYGSTIAGTRPNILTWAISNLKQGNAIKVVTDQQRTPTFIEDLVQGVLLAMQPGKEGIFHIGGKEELSPYDIVIRVAQRLNLNQQLISKADSSNFTQPAERPLRTGFDISKAEKELGYSPKSFEEALEIVIKKFE